MQALGRARGINRTDGTPLAIDLLFDTCLPVSVNEVCLWEPPSLMIETAAQGVMLTSPTDMVKLWPERRKYEASDCSLQPSPHSRPDIVAAGEAWKGDSVRARLGCDALRILSRCFIGFRPKRASMKSMT
jgi:hypothetical protein